MYTHFEDFFIEQRWLKFCIFYHISTPCVIVYVLYAVILKRNLTIIILITAVEQGAVNNAVCFTVIGTQTKVPRNMQASQR